MKIVVIDKTSGNQRTGSKGGFQARVFGSNPVINTFAKSEVQALKQLVEKIEAKNDKYILTT